MLRSLITRNLAVDVKKYTPRVVEHVSISVCLHISKPLDSHVFAKLTIAANEMLGDIEGTLSTLLLLMPMYPKIHHTADLLM